MAFQIRPFGAYGVEAFDIKPASNQRIYRKSHDTSHDSFIIMKNIRDQIKPLPTKSGLVEMSAIFSSLPA